MSSYHSSFTYLKQNSSDDFKLLITHFDADSGETDSGLTQEQVYTSSYNGAKRILYGTRWSSVPTVKITVIKQNRSDFTVAECRAIYKWLTGNPIASWLDLYAGDDLKYSFLGTVQDVKPEKLDARTIGMNIYFESLHPWAFSPEQTSSTSFGQALDVDEGVLYKMGQNLDVNNAGVLSNGTNATFDISEDGVIYIDNSVEMSIENDSDDLYSCIPLYTKFVNINSTEFSITNETLYDMTDGADGFTEINNLIAGETIELTAEKMIMSDAPNRIFGDSFNFIWPKLISGVNKIVVSGSGKGEVYFTYRNIIKIGDCAIDVFTSDNDDCDCSDNTTYGTISWSDIADTPTTIGGYGITDAYTSAEIDTKIENIEVSGGGGGGVAGDVTIDEAELNQMLDEILGD